MKRQTRSRPRQSGTRHQIRDRTFPRRLSHVLKRHVQELRAIVAGHGDGGTGPDGAVDHLADLPASIRAIRPEEADVVALAPPAGPGAVVARRNGSVAANFPFCHEFEVSSLVNSLHGPFTE